MVPVEEGELPEEGLVSSRAGGAEGRKGGAARASEGADLVGRQGGRGDERQRQPSDQGLEKLERAKGLLLEGGAVANISEVRCCPPVWCHVSHGTRYAIVYVNRRAHASHGA